VLHPNRTILKKLRKLLHRFSALCWRFHGKARISPRRPLACKLIPQASNRQKAKFAASIGTKRERVAPHLNRQRVETAVTDINESDYTVR
jgi:hypothetical protein